MVDLKSKSIEERKDEFKSFCKDAQRTSSVLQDSSISKYMSGLTSYEMTLIVKQICNELDIFNLTESNKIKPILRLYQSLRDSFPGTKTAPHVHYNDLSSYISKYMEFLNDCNEVENDSTEFSISHIIQQIQTTGLIYDDNLIKRYAFSLLTKPFVILSGLAGSGKTQLAIAFANSICSNPDDQVLVVPVGADWTNREPLLGYANALDKDDYVQPESDVLSLLVKASSNVTKPYFLILDEMNMSYVERYFADFLSAMESGKEIKLWKGNTAEAPSSLKLPKNLFIVGTINVDETTYMFSPKVLDRANVLEFKVSSNDMKKFLSNISTTDIDGLKAANDGIGSSFVELAKHDNCAVNEGIMNVMLAFFDELKKVNAEFGYRSAKEIYKFISIASDNDDTQNKMKTDDIIDSAVVQKLLPKLHGSRNSLKDVLNSLWKLCFTGEVVDLSIADYGTLNPDNNASYKVRYPESANKILRMYKNAVANGFTSFAEA